MNIMAGQMGIEDAVRVVAREFGRFAGKGVLTPTPASPFVRRLGEVEIMFDQQEPGLAHFRFVTPDYIELRVGVQFLTLDRLALAKILESVVEKIKTHQAHRQTNSRPSLILLPGGRA